MCAGHVHRTRKHHNRDRTRARVNAHGVQHVATLPTPWHKHIEEQQRGSALLQRGKYLIGAIYVCDLVSGGFEKHTVNFVCVLVVVS